MQFRRLSVILSIVVAYAFLFESLTAQQFYSSQPRNTAPVSAAPVISGSVLPISNPGEIVQAEYSPSMEFHSAPLFEAAKNSPTPKTKSKMVFDNEGFEADSNPFWLDSNERTTTSRPAVPALITQSEIEESLKTIASKASELLNFSSISLNPADRTRLTTPELETTAVKTLRNQPAPPPSEAPAANSESTSVKELDPESEISHSLAELLEIQMQTKLVLPMVLPAVVAIEGGSGVIVSQTGYILTASHVTKRAGRTVEVKLADGRIASAITLGTNVNTDTAALKLYGDGPWPYVSMNETADIEDGDWSLAIGYPLSFDRGKPGAVRIGRVLQRDKNRITTDCPIMGGDSGGPLFNLDGKLIGISSRVKSDMNQNIHVPIKAYQDQWQQLVDSIDVSKSRKSKSTRCYFGVLGETDSKRVRIRQVFGGSPAEMAGIMKNDVIVSFDGIQVKKFDDIVGVLERRNPGDTIPAQLNRYGVLMQISIHLEKSGGN